jgi:Arginase family
MLTPISRADLYLNNSSIFLTLRLSVKIVSRKIEEITLEGKLILLESLSLIHLDDLTNVGITGEFWRLIPTRIRSRDDMKRHIKSTLDEKSRGIWLLFATVLCETEKEIGSLVLEKIIAVRSFDAPGTSAPSPIGLRGGEFITLVKLAVSLSDTKIIEFTEVTPNYDIDHRTTKLVAIATHRFCSAK